MNYFYNKNAGWNRGTASSVPSLSLNLVLASFFLLYNELFMYSPSLGAAGPPAYSPPCPPHLFPQSLAQGQAHSRLVEWQAVLLACMEATKDGVVLESLISDSQKGGCRVYSWIYSPDPRGRPRVFALSTRLWGSDLPGMIV